MQFYKPLAKLHGAMCVILHICREDDVKLKRVQKRFIKMFPGVVDLSCRERLETFFFGV